MPYKITARITDEAEPLAWTRIITRGTITLDQHELETRLLGIQGLDTLEVARRVAGLPLRGGVIDLYAAGATVAVDPIRWDEFDTLDTEE